MTTSLLHLATPRVLVDADRLKANITAMQSLANRAGVRLRPHAKTHKSVRIARWQIDAGAVGICCAKLGEAEVFAAAGIADIRLPYPINPSNADRVAALLNHTRLSLIVDDMDVARAWSEAMTSRGLRLDVLAKIDVGFHRCGFDPDAAGIVDRLAHIAALRGLNFRGLLSHAGHAYLAASEEALSEITLNEVRILRAIADALAARGVEVPEISVGSTPSARFIEQQSGVTEMRPGNYVLFDRTQIGLGAATADSCAMTVLSMVVSRPSPTRVVFDAGSKTLTSDGARGFSPAPGHGLVYPGIDATRPDPSIVIERLSEEHAVARVDTDCALRVGDLVRIIPNHSCPVTNLADEVLLTSNGIVTDTIMVDARGKNK